MELMWVKVQGYKRFFETSKFNMQGKVIAIVGPNESGKSSFLSVLTHLNSSRKFILDGVERELTRGENIKESQIIIEAAYLLEKDDIEEISDIHGGKNVKRLYEYKKANGDFGYKLEPNPIRDTSQRPNIIKLLERFLAT